MTNLTVAVYSFLYLYLLEWAALSCANYLTKSEISALASLLLYLLSLILYLAETFDDSF